VIDQLEDVGAQKHPRLKDLLPGPLSALPTTEVLQISFNSHRAGLNMLQLQKWTAEFGGSLSANIVVPAIIAPDNGMPYIDDLVIVNCADDAERLARVHVRKSPFYQLLFLGKNGVLSTRDLELWQAQRRHVADAFLPLASLAKVFDVSAKRAKWAVLTKLAAQADGSVEMHEFMLYEAMAQLQLTMLGETEEFVER
jgi:hypothetical protein